MEIQITVTKCDWCGEIEYCEEPVVHISEEESYCSKACAKAAGYRRCDECEKWEWEDDVYELDGVTYCKECYEHLKDDSGN